MGDRITYVGLDVHKAGIVVAVAEGGLRGEVREYGRIANTAGALDRLMRKLGSAGVGLRFCYEAGPCPQLIEGPQNDLGLRPFRATLDEIYGRRLERFVLYGSRARGDARPDSDYNAAIFLRDMPDRIAELYRLADLSTAILENGGDFIRAMRDPPSSSKPAGISGRGIPEYMAGLERFSTESTHSARITPTRPAPIEGAGVQIGALIQALPL